MQFNRQRQAVITNELVDIIVSDTKSVECRAWLSAFLSILDRCFCAIGALLCSRRAFAFGQNCVDKLEAQNP